LRQKISKYLFPFEKLEVYQMALDLADRVLEFLEELPQNRHLRLISQMEAAAVSSAQNIAEGKGRQYKKEFIQYLHISQGSVYEVVTLNEVFGRRNLLSEEQASEIRDRCEQIDRKLNGLVNSLRRTRGRSYPGGDV
jgi:four helix bundle protein